MTLKTPKKAQNNLFRLVANQYFMQIFSGVFTGYSSLGWALVIPDDGKVIACDVDAENPTKHGLPNWKEVRKNEEFKFIDHY